MNLTKICSLLNAYMFNNVWNKPYTHFKRNISLQRLHKRYSSFIKHSVTGSLVTPSHTILLPNINEPYYVYYIDRSLFDCEVLDLNVGWKSIAELSDNRYTLTAILDGFTLSRSKVYFYHYVPSDDIFVAISKKMLNKICGVNYDPDNVHMIIRNDWDDKDTSTCSSFVISSEDHRLAAWTRSQSEYSYCFINGQLSTFNYNEITIGDYVDFVKDDRLVIQYELDLTSDRDKNTFVSSEDNKIYSLCHIPKEFNPTNTIVNCMDIDIFVSSVHSNISVKGLYLQSSVLKLKQVTHNDFGIPEDLLTSYGYRIGSQELTIKLFVRRFVHPLVLLRDQNYIDLLYKHTDTEIINFLTNHTVLNMNFWTADHLAKSNYIKALYSYPAFVNMSNINEHIETFGYQNILAILTDSVRKFSYNKEIRYPLIIKRPALFSNSVLPLVFINGNKIKNSILCIDRLSSDYTAISINDVDALYDGDNCIIKLIENTLLSHVHFQPLVMLDRITVTDNYKIYRKVETIEILGVNRIYTTSFQEVSDEYYSSSLSGTQRTYVFYSFTFGTDFYFIPKEGSYIVERTFNNDRLYPMVIDLETSLLNTEEIIPYLDIQTTEVFLNGKTLVENIDYRLFKHIVGNDICGVQIVIYNASYGSNILNEVEILVSRNTSDKTYSFLRGSNDHTVENVYNWFDSIGTVSVDGKQTFNVLNTNDGVFINEPHRSGALVETSVIYPKQINEFVSSFYTAEADERDRILVEYFNAITPNDTSTVALPHAHHLYSLKVCVIANDIINGVLNIPYEPNIFKLLNEDLVNYKYLDAFDILKTNIDKLFVDFLLAYRDVVIPDIEKYKLINHIAYAIINDPLNYGGIS